MSSILYIPENYIAKSVAWGRLYVSSQETNQNIALINSLISNSILWITKTLRFKPTRRLHVCVYDSNQIAQDSLDRLIPDNMAMSPYQSHTDALVIVHSPSINKANADSARMSRILIHELCHVYLAEHSGATKILGDGNEGKAVHSWFDEGFAEYMALTLTGDSHRLENAFNVAERTAPMTDAQLNQALDNLDSELRLTAFAVAVSRVAAMAQKTGIRSVFENATRYFIRP